MPHSQGLQPISMHSSPELGAGGWELGAGSRPLSDKEGVRVSGETSEDRCQIPKTRTLEPLTHHWPLKSVSFKESSLRGGRDLGGVRVSTHKMKTWRDSLLPSRPSHVPGIQYKRRTKHPRELSWKPASESEPTSDEVFKTIDKRFPLFNSQWFKKPV